MCHTQLQGSANSVWNTCTDLFAFTLRDLNPHHGNLPNHNLNTLQVGAYLTVRSIAIILELDYQSEDE